MLFKAVEEAIKADSSLIQTNSLNLRLHLGVINGNCGLPDLQKMKMFRCALSVARRKSLLELLQNNIGVNQFRHFSWASILIPIPL